MIQKWVLVFVMVLLCSSFVVAQDWRVEFSASANPTLDDANVRFSSSGEFTFSTEGDMIVGSGSGSVDASFSSPDCSGSESTSFDFPVSGSLILCRVQLPSAGRERYVPTVFLRPRSRRRARHAALRRQSRAWSCRRARQLSALARRRFQTRPRRCAARQV